MGFVARSTLNFSTGVEHVFSDGFGATRSNDTDDRHAAKLTRIRGLVADSRSCGAGVEETGISGGQSGIVNKRDRVVVAKVRSKVSG